VKIYFAGAIRGGRVAALYSQIVQLRRAYGEVLTDQIGDAELSDLGEALNDRAIYERDVAWLNEADCLVAEVTTPSLGVGYEIGKVTEWGRPVLCLYPPDASRKLSALIAAGDGARIRNSRTLTS
jgi:nucleoside 2-deoxyribosyltransferase